MQGKRKHSTHVGHVLLVLLDATRKVHLQHPDNVHVAVDVVAARHGQARRQAELGQLRVGDGGDAGGGLVPERGDELVRLADGDAVVDEAQQVGARRAVGGRVDGAGRQDRHELVGCRELLLLVHDVERDALREDQRLRADRVGRHGGDVAARRGRGVGGVRGGGQLRQGGGAAEAQGQDDIVDSGGVHLFFFLIFLGKGL